MNVLRPVIASNGVPYFKMISVGSQSTSEKEKEGKKKRFGRGLRSGGSNGIIKKRMYLPMLQNFLQMLKRARRPCIRHNHGWENSNTYIHFIRA